MAGYDFIISQSPKSSTVSVWRFDPHKEEPFKEVKLDSKTSRIKKLHSGFPLADGKDAKTPTIECASD